jgi:hypothetical protein
MERHRPLGAAAAALEATTWTKHRDALVSWLSEVLSPAETTRLREFMLESARESAIGTRRGGQAE